MPSVVMMNVVAPLETLKGPTWIEVVTPGSRNVVRISCPGPVVFQEAVEPLEVVSKVGTAGVVETLHLTVDD